MNWMFQSRLLACPTWRSTIGKKASEGRIPPGSRADTGSRTGHRGLVHDALFERIPSGARFRYVTGSMLVFAFVTQVITGIFLWMCYSPSSTTAYESVYYIQHEVTGGWLLRGIHHFMAQAMVVTMGLHLFQVVWDGAYRPPRE